MKHSVLLLLLLGPLSLLAQTDAPMADTSQKEKIYTMVEEMPDYYGGVEAMYTFIRKNLEYPKEAKEHKIKGTVRVKFIVQKDGSLTDLQVVSKENPGYGCEEAALDVIRKMPNWRAGRMNGRPVATYFNVLIYFPPGKR